MLRSRQVVLPAGAGIASPTKAFAASSSSGGQWRQLSLEEAGRLLEWLNPQGAREGPLRASLAKTLESMKRLRKAAADKAGGEANGDKMSRKPSSAALAAPEAGTFAS